MDKNSDTPESGCTNIDSNANENGIIQAELDRIPPELFHLAVFACSGSASYSRNCFPSSPSNGLTRRG